MKKDIFRGCLVGGAAGDALGYAVEFEKAKDIFRNYGKTGITQYDLVKGKALISDDTQMMLFTAMGLILADEAAKRSENPVPAYREKIAQCYQDWYHTQDDIYREGWESIAKGDWLMGIPDMYHRRAPGNTCMHALSIGGDGTMEDPINESKGCGGVMRVAPIGLFFSGRDMDWTRIDELGACASALTHGHHLSSLSSAAFVHMILRITEGMPIREAAEDAAKGIQELFPEPVYPSAAIAGLLQKALDLALTDLNDLTAIHRLGEGWIAEEALAVGVYCAAKYPEDLDRCLIAAVNHDGDSDSTAILAGNLVGASIGYDRIPEKWKTNLELHDTIVKIADQMAQCG